MGKRNSRCETPDQSFFQEYFSIDTAYISRSSAVIILSGPPEKSDLDLLGLNISDLISVQMWIQSK